MGPRLDKPLRRALHPELFAALLRDIHPKFRTVWRVIRQLSGDDAYERYLAHHATCHASMPALTRKEYFRRREEEKWGGVRRCC